MIYKLVFKLGRERRTRKIVAKNYGHAESLGDSAVRRYKRDEGKNVELVSVERQYKVDGEKPKAQKKVKMSLSEHALQSVGMIPFFFE